ncbi:hypothetical protein EIP91_007495 [Steccherinum ochraceum]|uniref:Uncharacterized protein n=1 Tax=Steccherinum ochraceum TaxID=92696 RepID=A0A4R0R6V0_9APHY|nr:hypothetical protein EIP91_007495 [Steccherinum ochraceum]
MKPEISSSLPSPVIRASASKGCPNRLIPLHTYDAKVASSLEVLWPAPLVSIKSWYFRIKRPKGQVAFIGKRVIEFDPENNVPVPLCGPYRPTTFPDRRQNLRIYEDLIECQYESRHPTFPAYARPPRTQPQYRGQSLRCKWLRVAGAFKGAERVLE